MAERTDSDLMRAATAGDDGAFGELALRHEQALLRFLHGLLRDAEEARDCTQDAFVQAWRHRERFNTAMSFKTWLYTIGRNRAISILRQRKHRQTVSPVAGENPDEEWNPLDSIADAGFDPRESASREEDALWLRRALERLDEPHREVLQMKYFGGLKSREIADLLGLEVGTVWSRVHHGLRKLRAVFAEMNYDF